MIEAADRIEAVMAYKKIKNFPKLAEAIGANAQTFYSIKNGDYGISDLIALRITKKWPEISFDWLTLGDGEMLIPEPAPSESMVAYATGNAKINQAKGKEVQIIEEGDASAINAEILRLGIELEKERAAHQATKEYVKTLLDIIKSR